jgi:uncharacterized protein YecE (DUF72 family)
MSQLPLFEPEPDLPPQAARLAPKLRALAEQGVYFGTSSWKYPGWLGSIYAPERYSVRGKLSRRKFESECLHEYAATFPAVGGDFSFYQFPSSEYWRRLFTESPESLRFGLKVPEDVTVHTWPRHDRYGPRSGRANEHFLDADVFAHAFARPLEPYRDRVAVLMFEFGTFSRASFVAPGDFLGRLNAFLGRLPGGFRYAVEIRNPEWFGPEYLGTLAGHNVAHVFNAWTRMPELTRQVATPGAFTADFIVARALLKRGRAYEQAVRQFEPYERVQEPNPGARDGLRQLAERARRVKCPAFLFVNNRLEGNAPGTIEAVADELL